jgi:hypothetical protein
LTEFIEADDLCVKGKQYPREDRNATPSPQGFVDFMVGDWRSGQLLAKGSVFEEEYRQVLDKSPTSQTLERAGIRAGRDLSGQASLKKRSIG